jgi:hypothetical protein
LSIRVDRDRPFSVSCAWIEYGTLARRLVLCMVARFVLTKYIKMGKIYQITKWILYIPNDHEMYQHFPFQVQVPPKFT